MEQMHTMSQETRDVHRIAWVRVIINRVQPDTWAHQFWTQTLDRLERQREQRQIVR